MSKAIGGWSFRDRKTGKEVTATLYADDTSPLNLPFSHIGFELYRNDNDKCIADGYIALPYDIESYIKEAKNAKLLKRGYTEDEVNWGYTFTESGDLDVDLDTIKPKWTEEETEELTQKIVDDVYNNPSEVYLNDFDVDLLEEIDNWFWSYVYELVTEELDYYFVKDQNQRLF